MPSCTSRKYYFYKCKKEKKEELPFSIVLRFHTAPLLPSPQIKALQPCESDFEGSATTQHIKDPAFCWEMAHCLSQLQDCCSLQVILNTHLNPEQPRSTSVLTTSQCNSVTHSHSFTTLDTE